MTRRLRLAHEGSFVQAEELFWREIELGGNVDGAVSNLLRGYLARGEIEKASVLTRDTRTAAFVPNDTRRAIALLSGRVLEYVGRTFVPSLRVSFGAAASALLICFLWFSFLWRIDVFEQEPWSAALLALGAGAVLAPATGFLHDLLYVLLPLEENGLGICVYTSGSSRRR